jgi:membrane protease YdiL (CAAX protease family)
MFESRPYLTATRQPLACLLFVVPLLVAYEAGVWTLSLEHPDMLRNGADVWLRWVLSTVGLRHILWAPCLVVLVLVLWCCRDRGRGPRDYVGLWLGMTTESVLFALMLWGGCQVMGPLLYRLGVPLSTQSQPELAMQQLLCFVGAGIYEETLFRLLLFSGLRRLLQCIEIPWPGAGMLAALVSALLFSAAHNIGPYGEAFQPFVFAFRTAAGLYFVLLYQLRGFGIAVGTHAGYDVLVGLLADF